MTSKLNHVCDKEDSIHHGYRCVDKRAYGRGYPLCEACRSKYSSIAELNSPLALEMEATEQVKRFNAQHAGGK